MKDKDLKSKHDTDTKANTNNGENIPAKPKEEKTPRKEPKTLTETVEESEMASKNQNTLKLPEELGSVNPENTDLN